MLRFTRVLSALAVIGAVNWCVSLAWGDVKVDRDVVYGKGGDLELRLDIAYPEGDGPFPAIVCIHGGGWAGGNRHSYQEFIEQAAGRGYVAATISYRLTAPDRETKVAAHPFPAQVEDCKCAIRWLRANAAKYHVNPDRIGVTGGSAGGHLSLMVGMTTADDKLEGTGGHAEQSSKVQAVVNVFGPADLVRGYEDVPAVRDLLHWFCGGSPKERPEAYRQASPVTYARRDNPPILTIHGTEDTIVPYEQAKILDRKLAEVKASHELLTLTGQGHGFTGDAFQQALDATWKFFDQHLKAK